MHRFCCGLVAVLVAVIFAPPPAAGHSNFFFDNHHFNLILIGDLVKDLFVAGEVEYEHAGEEIALEYAYFGYTGIKNLRILAGKFIVPFGRFNKDLHPTVIAPDLQRCRSLGLRGRSTQHGRYSSCLGWLYRQWVDGGRWWGHPGRP